MIEDVATVYSGIGTRSAHSDPPVVCSLSHPADLLERSDLTNKYDHLYIPSLILLTLQYVDSNQHNIGDKI